MKDFDASDSERMWIVFGREKRRQSGSGAGRGDERENSEGGDGAK